MALTNDQFTITLEVDSIGAVKSVRDASGAFTEYSNIVKKTDGVNEKAFSGFKGMGVAIIAANQAVELAKKAFNALSAPIMRAVNEAAEAERQTTQLNFALAQVGEFSEQTVKEIDRFARQMELTTEIGDDLVKSLIGLGVAQGKTVEQSKKNVVVAADLAAVLGTDVKSAYEQINTLNAGNARGLANRFTALQRFTEEELKAGKGAEYLAKQLEGTAAALAKTGTGQFAQFTNAISNLFEEAGNVIQAVLGGPTILSALTQFVRNTTERLEQLKPVIAETLGPIIDGVTAFAKALLAVDFSSIAKQLNYIGVALGVIAGILAGPMIVNMLQFTVIAAAIGGAVLAIDLLIRNFDKLGSVVELVVGGIIIALKKVVQGIAFVGGALSKVLGLEETKQNFDAIIEEKQREIDAVSAQMSNIASSENIDLGLAGSLAKELEAFKQNFKIGIQDAQKQRTELSNALTPKNKAKQEKFSPVSDDTLNKFKDLQNKINELNRANATSGMSERQIIEYNLQLRLKEVESIQEQLKNQGLLAGKENALAQARKVFSDQRDAALAKLPALNAEQQKSFDEIMNIAEETSKIQELSGLNRFDLIEKEKQSHLEQISNLELILSAELERTIDAQKRFEIEAKIAKLHGAKEGIVTKAKISTETEGGSAGKAIENVFGGFSSSIKGFSTSFSNALSPITGIMGAATSIVGAIQGLIDFIPNMLGSITNIFTSLTDLPMKIVAGLGKLFNSILNFLTNFASNLGSMVTGIIDGLISFLEKLPDALMKFINDIPVFIQKLIDGVIKFFEKLPSLIEKLIPMFLSIAPKLVTGLISAVVKGIPKLIIAFLKAIPVMIKGLIQGLIEAFASIGSIFSGGLMGADTGEQIGESIGKGVQSSLTGVGEQTFAIMEMGAEKGSLKIGEAAKEQINQATDRGAGIFGGLWKTLEKIFQVVGPIFTKVGEILGKVFAAVMPIFEKVVTIIGKVFEVVAGILVKVFELVVPIFDIVATVLTKVFDLVLPIFDMVANVLGKVFDAITPIFDAVIAALEPVFAAIGPIFDAIIAALEPVFAAIGPIMDAVIAILKPILDVVAPVLDAIIQILNPIIEVITVVLEKVTSVISPIFTLIAGVFGEAAKILNPIIDYFKSTFEYIKTLLMAPIDLFKAAFKFLQDLFEDPVKALKEFGGAIWDIFKNIWEKFTNVFSSIGKIFTGIFDAAGNIGKKIVDYFKKFIPKAVREWLGWEDEKKSGPSMFENWNPTGLKEGETYQNLNIKEIKIDPAMLKGGFAMPGMDSFGKMMKQAEVYRAQGMSEANIKVLIEADEKAGVFKAAGGLISYLQGGGFPMIPRGTDTVPAMLTPGEFVMSRPAVNRLGVDNLMAMNRGQKVGGNTSIEVNIDIKQVDKLDDSFIKNRLVPTLKQELKRATLDGEFIISAKGIR